MTPATEAARGEHLGSRPATVAPLCTAPVVLVLAGRLADLHGRRRVFIVGMTLFSAASLACGLSGSAAMLIAARTVQGLGAAAVAPAALAAITAAFPDGRARRRALGVWTAAAAGGGATGWVLGGLLTETTAGGAGRRLDVAGAATITIALALLVLGCTRAQVEGPLSPPAIGGVAAGLVM